MNEKQSDNANVIVHPPLIFIIFFLVGLLLDYLYQYKLFPIDHRDLSLLIPGYIVIFISLIIVAASIQTLKKRNTTHKVSEPTTALVKTGIYQYTRNPIYLSVIILFIGISLLINSIIMLLLIIPMFIILNEGVVKREEKYLQSKFGDEYADYKNSVKRWI